MGGAAGTAGTTGTTTNVPAQCRGAISLSNDNLLEAVRDAIEKPTGDIYYDDVDELVEFTAWRGGLTHLTSLDVGSNSVSDISPLADNVGIDGRHETEVFVSVDGNPLDCDDPATQGHIATLQGRAVWLAHDCQ